MTSLRERWHVLCSQRQSQHVGENSFYSRYLPSVPEKVIPYFPEGPPETMTLKDLRDPKKVAQHLFQKELYFARRYSDSSFQTETFSLLEWLLEQDSTFLTQVMEALGFIGLPFDLETYVTLFFLTQHTREIMIEVPEVIQWLCHLSPRELIELIPHGDFNHGERLWFATHGSLYYVNRLPGPFDKLSALLLIRKGVLQNCNHIFYRSDGFGIPKDFKSRVSYSEFDPLVWSRENCLLALFERTGYVWSQKVVGEVNKVLGVSVLSTLIGEYTPGNVEEMAVMIGMIPPDHLESYTAKEQHFLDNLKSYRSLIAHEGPTELGGCPTGGGPQCRCVESGVLRDAFCTDLELITQYPTIKEIVLTRQIYRNRFGPPKEGFKYPWNSREHLCEAIRIFTFEEDIDDYYNPEDCLGLPDYDEETEPEKLLEELSDEIASPIEHLALLEASDIPLPLELIQCLDSLNK